MNFVLLVHDRCFRETTVFKMTFSRDHVCGQNLAVIMKDKVTFVLWVFLWQIIDNVIDATK